MSVFDTILQKCHDKRIQILHQKAGSCTTDVSRFKVQKRSKDIDQIVHVISVVQEPAFWRRIWMRL